MLRSPQPRLPQQVPGGYPPPPQTQQQRSVTAQPPAQAKQPQQMEHQDVVHDTQFDYYGQLLATASSDRTVGIHVVQNGQLQRIATLTGHEGPVWMVSWAHPRFGIALASAGYDHKAIIWKEVPQGSKQWAPVHVIDCHHGSVNAVNWAPESAMVATASSDGTVAVTTYEGGVWRESLKLSNNSNNIAHAMGATSVSFAPVCPALSDVTLLVSGGCDSHVRLWCLHEANPTAHSFELLDALDAHTDWVRDVAFSPLCAATRHAVIASCGQDKSVIIHRKPWDQIEALIQEKRQNTSGSGMQLQSMKEVGGTWERSVVLFDEPVWRLSWSPAGEMLVVTTGDSEVYVLRENGEFTQPWLKTPLSEYQEQLQ
ncbi:protein transport protein sec13 [Trypanosoma rangeli]|uniref:Protein transport protein sec13 n=1 Tax=Trypanosoma rangeli TaxID=5698 RepID=A0A422NPX8_TRYRA|nr:protein transport protein sec13 [Trypanosoma rangeli]RNF07496.1 protein transport protein sec13 [Trypanosoma rangeli]|eukprot:RNF07496.1 protein transport protein sec13 [Trypanosoma rangeli]